MRNTVKRPWSPDNVSARRIPNMIRRTHLEHCMLRDIFTSLQPMSIVEFGCGYGRLLPVAFEVTDKVAALERDPEMVREAVAMFPDALAIREQRDLWEPVFGDDGFDLAYSFTVLQHIESAFVPAIIQEMQRVARRYVLIVEETDPSYRRRPENPVYFTIGRPVEWYREQMRGWELVDIRRRPNEPGYTYKKQPKPYSGHYMLFRRQS